MKNKGYTKEFDLVPVVINYTNGDSERLYVCEDFKGYMERQFDLQETLTMFITYYTTEPVLNLALRVNRKLIPYVNIRDLDFPQPEYKTGDHINEVDLAVWATPNNERIIGCNTFVGGI